MTIGVWQARFIILGQALATSSEDKDWEESV